MFASHNYNCLIVRNIDRPRGIGQHGFGLADDKALQLVPVYKIRINNRVTILIIVLGFTVYSFTYYCIVIANIEIKMFSRMALPDNLDSSIRKQTTHSRRGSCSNTSTNISELCICNQVASDQNTANGMVAIHVVAIAPFIAVAPLLSLRI